MRSFWYNDSGHNIEIIFKLIKNGRWWYDDETKRKIGIEFDYPYPENDDEIRIGMSDLEDLDLQIRSMLFQSLKMDAPEFGLAYS